MTRNFNNYDYCHLRLGSQRLYLIYHQVVNFMIMKKLLLILSVLFAFQFTSAQHEDTMKMVNLGSLFEVTIYYDNGKIMQHGFLTPDNKLHASWESYYEDGTKKCVATYDKGVKTGIWYYYYNDSTKRVTYEDNKIVEVEELDPKF